MLQAVRLLTEMARTSNDRSRGDGSASDAQASSSNSEESQMVPPESAPLFRELVKNGWLRRVDCKADKERCSRYWVAFCVHDEAEPRLEGFANKVQGSRHSPVWSQSLRAVQHLSPTLCATAKSDYEFCVSLGDDRVLRLAAPTYQAMLDWVQVVTRKLTEMKVLGPKENLYSRPPERSATRDPTSPLPPPPSLSTSSGRTAANSASPSTSSAPTVFTFDDIGLEERRPSNPWQPAGRPAPPVPPSPRLTGGGGSSSTTPGDSSYESVFLASSAYPTSAESSRSNNNNASTSRSQSSSDESDQYAALIECRSSDRNAETSSSVAAAGSAVVVVAPAAAAAASVVVPAGPASSQSRPARTQLTLREQQVLQLRKEMSHPAGVRIKVGRRDYKDSIAFVDCFGAVWIAGWKHKECPFLYNVLHVGDLVLSVAGVSLNRASSVKDIIKNHRLPCVEMIVRRLPHGRVTTLTRRSEAEDFGLEVGPANEVLSVSAAAQSLGLSVIANPADPGAEIGTTVGWSLTEVNNRPLNLFEGSARERIGAALGRDLSVVLQPSDLVAALRKKLRAVRSYKSFVLQ